MPVWNIKIYKLENRDNLVVLKATQGLCRQTFGELKHKVGDYITKYNNERYQRGLKKMTPVQYRVHLLTA